MDTELLGISRNGVEVYDRFFSHVHEEGGLTKELLSEAISKVFITKGFAEYVVDMGREIGCTTCVPVTNDDDVEYVYRIGRMGKTPMVHNRAPLPCKYIKMVIAQNYEGDFVMITCFIGKGGYREPWDKSIRSIKEKRASEEYWRTHALIFDPDLIDWDRTTI